MVEQAHSRDCSQCTSAVRMLRRVLCGVLRGSTLCIGLPEGFGLNLQALPGERRARDTPCTPMADVLHTACMLIICAVVDTGCEYGERKVACATCRAARNPTCFI